MKKIALVVALCVAVFVVTTAIAFSQNNALRVFLHGEKKLTDHWNMVSHNVIPNLTQSSDAYVYFGPRYKFNRGFADFFLGYSFLKGNDNSVLVSPRFLYSVGKFYIWTDAEWYPKWNSVYTSAMLEWLPGVGVELGCESETYSPESEKTVWNLGPNIIYNLSDKMTLDLTWQYKKVEFGGSFARLTIILNF